MISSLFDTPPCFSSASGFPSGFLTNSLGSTTFTFTNTVTGLGGGGQIQPASSVPQSGVPRYCQQKSIFRDFDTIISVLA
jgi:hypothetical protein